MVHWVELYFPPEALISVFRYPQEHLQDFYAFEAGYVQLFAVQRALMKMMELERVSDYHHSQFDLLDFVDVSSASLSESASDCNCSVVAWLSSDSTKLLVEGLGRNWSCRKCRRGPQNVEVESFLILYESSPLNFFTYFAQLFLKWKLICYEKKCSAGLIDRKNRLSLCNKLKLQIYIWSCMPDEANKQKHVSPGSSLFPFCFHLFFLFALYS